MKKILAAVTAGALCMALVGCGGIFLTKSDKEKFYVTDPSLHVLEDMDEFGVYEDGKAILTAEEIGEGGCGFGFNIPYSDALGERYAGKEYDFRGRNITTKRGIGIGSTMEEVIEAYPDTACILAPDVKKSTSDNAPYIFDVSPAQVEYRIRDYEDEEPYFRIERYETKDGELLSSAGYYDYIYDNDLSRYYVYDHEEEYFESEWALNFHIKDGVVSMLGISVDLY
ncbi:hypothetical protein [Christensenella tenuis]|uniref:Lipoprotein n=1 Tax=Christensenella tenuis TaxID=2763033 RepID=A0ABR7EEV1_9FIRM|nr:hypothetical protein [Christensenella tenuis]MBC5648271.1 hypothetical protein [Christensenella tenuis]